MMMAGMVGMLGDMSASVTQAGGLSHAGRRHEQSGAYDQASLDEPEDLIARDLR